jgi:L-iditol 2-dehydrogenase
VYEIMKSIAVIKPNELKVVDIPMPKYDDCQALVKTLASGICGSDRKIIHGTFKNIEEYPTLLGHEAVGEVVEIGKNVENFKVGDRVLIPYHDDPESGYQSAWGAFSEYGVVNDWRAMAKQGRGPDTPVRRFHLYAEGDPQ